VQGWRAWPSCSARMGLRGVSTTFTGSLPATRAPSKPAAHRASSRASRSTSATAFAIRRGDTLSALAARFHVAGGWQALWSANRRMVGNPNVIRVGQVLVIPR